MNPAFFVIGFLLGMIAGGLTMIEGYEADCRAMHQMRVKGAVFDCSVKVERP